MFSVLFIIYQVESLCYLVAVIHILTVLKHMFELFIALVCGSFLLGCYELRNALVYLFLKFILEYYRVVFFINILGHYLWNRYDLHL